MTTYVIYESPVQGSGLAGEKARSAPIPADNAKARETLERAGWKLVEEFEQEEADTEARASNLPRIAQEFLAAGQGEAELAFEEDAAMVDTLIETTEAPVFVTALGDQFWGGMGVTDAQRDALINAGYVGADSLNAATDAQLQGVPGVGPATVRNIRKALKQ